MVDAHNSWLINQNMDISLEMQQYTHRLVLTSRLGEELPDVHPGVYPLPQNPVSLPCFSHDVF